MSRLAVVSAVSVLALASALPAAAGPMPEIRASATNAVPECATPGRLMALVNDKASVDKRFSGIATDYMRHGEDIGVRWDYAFFQMLVETGNLTFKTGARNAEVRPAQNNFAALGANGKGDTGEKFADVSTGVRAHLEHVMVYGGNRVENAVADRTRKVQEWRVLESWQKKLKGPVTFADMARRWAPGADGYGPSIQAIAETFYKGYCAKPDPSPEMAEAARGKSTKVAALLEQQPERMEKVSGAELAKKAIADGKAADVQARQALGAGSVAAQPLKMLNAPAEPAAPIAPPTAAAAPTIEAPSATAKPQVQTASAAAAAKPLVSAQPPAAGQKCRVFTASYGGQKAMIVRSIVEGVVNFTVLDVNEGSEKREADAFISAYAKGGAVAGEFANQDQALEKAFDLCPEG